MIIFDANILITLSTAEETDEAYERLAGLVQDVVASKTVIGVPAPAWAEFLCGTDVATAGIVNATKKRSFIRVLAYDEVSAFETALIHRGAMATGKKRGASKASWQQVKVDRQILAIARQHGVKTIYTDDDDMIAEAARLGIDAIRPGDIPLKSRQNHLDFSASQTEPGSDPDDPDTPPTK